MSLALAIGLGVGSKILPKLADGALKGISGALSDGRSCNYHHGPKMEPGERLAHFRKRPLPPMEGGKGHKPEQVPPPPPPKPEEAGNSEVNAKNIGQVTNQEDCNNPNILINNGTINIGQNDGTASFNGCSTNPFVSSSDNSGSNNLLEILKMILLAGQQPLNMFSNMFS